MNVSPVDKDRFTLVSCVRHFHPGHHQTIHTAALTIQVHLVITMILKILVSSVELLQETVTVCLGEEDREV